VSQWFYSPWGAGASIEGAADELGFRLDVSQWVLIITGLAVVILAAVRRTRSNQVLAIALYLGLACGALFMTSRPSVVVWDAIPALSFLQFPWRFLFVVSLACAGLAAALISRISSTRVQALLVASMVVLQLGVHRTHLAPQSYIGHGEMNIDSRYWRYMPQALVNGFAERGYDPLCVTRQPAAGNRRWQVTAGVGRVTEVEVEDHRVVLDAQNEEPIRVTIYAHNFPGWVVRVNGAAAPVRPTPTDCFLEVAIPPGTHTVEAAFENTPVRTLGNGITGLSGIVIALLVVRFRSRAHRPGATASASDT
jgi:uncharacterized membrane protein YfhO